jgi:hypothetical protein
MIKLHMKSSKKRVKITKKNNFLNECIEKKKDAKKENKINKDKCAKKKKKKKKNK